MLAIADRGKVEARLHVSAAGVANRGEGLREQDKAQSDHHSDRGQRSVDGLDRILNCRRLHLRQPHDRDQSHGQKAQARQRLAVGRRRGVLIAAGSLPVLGGRESSRWRTV